MTYITIVTNIDGVRSAQAKEHVIKKKYKKKMAE